MTSGIVSFHNTQNLSLRDRNRLKQFLQLQAKREGKEIEQLSYVFCPTKEIVKINNLYLSHNYPTDIITFDLSIPKNKKIIAEIYICPEVVSKNATDYQQTKTAELHRVIFHGLLHLCGYNDKAPKDQKKMRNKENEWLEKYFVSRGTK